MKTLSEIAKFLEDHVIECQLTAGCGRCDEARECLASLRAMEVAEVPTEEVYEIDFGGHLKAKIRVVNNLISVEAAMNGYGNALSDTEIVCNHIQTKVTETPIGVTDEEITAMAFEFAPICSYDDDTEDVNQSIRRSVITLLKQLRNRMSSSEKPNNCTGGEG